MERVSDEWLRDKIRWLLECADDDEDGFTEERELMAFEELQQRRQQDAARDAENNATTEMFAALEKLCEAVKLYFEGGDEKREEALHELYFGRKH